MDVADTSSLVWVNTFTLGVSSDIYDVCIAWTAVQLLNFDRAPCILLSTIHFASDLALFQTRASIVRINIYTLLLIILHIICWNLWLNTHLRLLRFDLSGTHAICAIWGVVCEINDLLYTFNNFKFFDPSRTDELLLLSLHSHLIHLSLSRQFCFLHHFSCRMRRSNQIDMPCLLTFDLKVHLVGDGCTPWATYWLINRLKLLQSDPFFLFLLGYASSVSLSKAFW